MLNVVANESCKVDANGRFKFPSALKKQLLSEISDGFYVRKHFFEKGCLEIFTKNMWEKESSRINKLNLWHKNQSNISRVLSAAVFVELDSSDRFLIPIDLKKDAGINTDIKLISNAGNLEIWDLETFNQQHSSEALTPEMLMEVMEQIGFNYNE